MARSGRMASQRLFKSNFLHAGGAGKTRAKDRRQRARACTTSASMPSTGAALFATARNVRASGRHAGGGRGVGQRHVRSPTRRGLVNGGFGAPRSRGTLEGTKGDLAASRLRTSAPAAPPLTLDGRGASGASPRATVRAERYFYAESAEPHAEPAPTKVPLRSPRLLPLGGERPAVRLQPFAKRGAVLEQESAATTTRPRCSTRGPSGSMILTTGGKVIGKYLS